MEEEEEEEADTSSIQSDDEGGYLRVISLALKNNFLTHYP